MPVIHGQTMHEHDDYKVQQEFERLSRAVSAQNKIVEALDPDKAENFKPGNNPEHNPIRTKIVKAIWALTNEHNREIISKKVVQDENFVDTGKGHPKYEIGIIWELIAEKLEQELRTIPEAERVNIKAWAYTNPLQFVTWLSLNVFGIQSVQTEYDLDPYNPSFIIHLLNDEDSPAPNKYYGTDGVGIRGYHLLPSVAASGSGVLEYTLNWADVTPVITIGAIPENKVVQTAMIEVLSEFDTGFIAEIGDDSVYNRLMKVTENNLEKINKYHNYPDYKYTATTDIKLRSYGTATKGDLRILIYYH